MKRAGIALAVMLLGAGIAAANQDLVASRIQIMKDNGKSMAAFSQMAKGEKPYDQATVDASLAKLEAAAKKLPTLYPESTKNLQTEEKYAASSKVWENKADFEAHIAKLGKVAADHKGKITSLDSLKAAIPQFGDTCKSCHETYRIKKS
ncbi:c-type cytochrome [Afipia sp. TerB]